MWLPKSSPRTNSPAISNTRLRIHDRAPDNARTNPGPQSSSGTPGNSSRSTGQCRKKRLDEGQLPAMSEVSLVCLHLDVRVGKKRARIKQGLRPSAASVAVRRPASGISTSVPGIKH